MNIQVTVTGRLAEDVQSNPNTKKAIDAAVAQLFMFKYEKLQEMEKQANNSDLQDQGGSIIGHYPAPNGEIYLIYYPGASGTITACYSDEY